MEHVCHQYGQFMNYDFVSDYCYASSKVSRKSGDEKNIRNKEDRLSMA